MLNHYEMINKSNNNQTDTPLPPSEWITAVLNAPYSDSVKDALLVRLADNTVDMYGRTKMDMITPYTSICANCTKVTTWSVWADDICI